MKRHQKKRTSLEETINGHVTYLKRSLGNIVLFESLAEVHVYEAVKWTMEEHPWYNRTRYQAALHETGHFVASTVFGTGAHRAEIRGTPGGYGGWEGEVAFNGEYLDNPKSPHPSELLNRAKIIFSGSWTEEFIGHGDATSPVYEVLEFHILIAQAAKMLGASYPDLLDQTMSELTEFVEFYETEIVAIARMLEKRKEVTIWQPSIKKVIDVVRRKSESSTLPAKLCHDRALRDTMAGLPSAKYIVKHLVGV